MKMSWGYTGHDATIEQLKSCVGSGWVALLDELVKDLEALGWDGTIMQVKEKFGGLRFYISSTSNAVHDRISKAENDSYDICETCGQPGKARSGGWIKTLCDTCNQPKTEVK